jgi:hypothetical protein
LGSGHALTGERKKQRLQAAFFLELKNRTSQRVATTFCCFGKIPMSQKNRNPRGDDTHKGVELDTRDANRENAVCGEEVGSAQAPDLRTDEKNKLINPQKSQ